MLTADPFVMRPPQFISDMAYIKVQYLRLSEAAIIIEQLRVHVIPHFTSKKGSQ